MKAWPKYNRQPAEVAGIMSSRLDLTKCVAAVTRPYLPELAQGVTLSVVFVEKHDSNLLFPLLPF